MARDYYAWHDRENPVNSSDQGLHTWDDQLSDRSMPKVLERRKLVEALLAKVKALPVADWSKDDRVDSALFRAQLEQEAFSGRVLRFEETNPQLYVNECSTGIFSLLKKEYAPRRTRALAATARLRRMPAFLEQARKNLTRPVALYARLAAEAARRGDDLYQTSLMVLAGDLSPAEKQELTEARDAALSALHSFAAWLESRIPKMAAFVPMGRANYDLYLRHVHLLPFDAAQIEMLGQAELSRYAGSRRCSPTRRLHRRIRRAQRASRRTSKPSSPHTRRVRRR